jgi:hypothetical protein
MTDKVYRLLYAPRRIDREISRINDRISSLKYSLLASGIRYDKDSVQTSPSDRMTDVFAEIDELERKRDAMVFSRIDAMNRIETAIGFLEDDEQKTVLSRQYIGNESVDSLTGTMHYSRRKIYTIRRIALKNLENIVK